MTIGRRLEIIRGNLGLNQLEISEVMEVSNTTYTDYKKDRAKPSLDSLMRLCVKKRCSANWILFGYGPMWLDEKESEVIGKINDKLREIDEIIDGYRFYERTTSESQ